MKMGRIEAGTAAAAAAAPCKLPAPADPRKRGHESRA